MDTDSTSAPLSGEEIEEKNFSSRRIKDTPTGILRSDVGGMGRFSTEYKFGQKEILSLQPSVTFAEESLKSENSKGSLSLAFGRMQQLPSYSHKEERVQFPEESVDGKESDEDDYSASVNAIIQRRASTRRSKKQNRRASSPFLPETPGPERRRSSVFTTSSGDTAITVDENAMNEVTQDEIFENIKLHKEVLSNVKMQPWNMRKKLKLVIQAKSYIKKHEGQLQERLAQSHSTKDMLARWNIMLIKKWQKWKRELTNISMWFIPWELKIKEIESHFGSVVASYFIFLRWLFWVNIVIAVVIISFVTIPEIITADPEAVKDRKFVLPEEKYNSTNFLTLWDFEGIFKYSPLFYGWYTNRDYNDSTVFSSFDGKRSHGHGYRLPFAYFVTGLVVYAYSFFATLRKMAENSRMSKLSEKDDECIFSWKVFTAWDYMIGNAETAHNRVASIIMGFKEALLEEAEKKRESRNWKVICFRVLVNMLVAGLLTCSAFAVVIVVKRSQEPEANSTIWRRNEITVVMSLITLFFPMLFEVLGFIEQYHPRKQLRLQLGRIMVLNLLNLYSLIFALFYKISDMTDLLQDIKTNISKYQSTDAFLYTTPTGLELTQAYEDNNSAVQCTCNNDSIDTQTIVSLDMVSALAQNLSSALTPTLNNLIKMFSEGGNVSESSFSRTEDFSYTAATFTDGSSFPSTMEDILTSTEIPTYFENSSFSYENVTNEYFYDASNTTDIGLELPYELSAEDIKTLFVDYLTFILSPFFESNTSDISPFYNFNFSVNDSLVNDNTTLSYPNTDYEHFKSTILPLFNNTIPEEEQRFDVELTSIFEEITTTISSLPDIFTTSLTVTSEDYSDSTTENTDGYYLCQSYCKTIHDLRKRISTSPSTPSSTALTTVRYGEIEYRKILNYSMNAKLRSLCWETMFGQELIKLTVMDLIMTGLSILMMDFFRGIFVRVMNRCWCWDLEKKFPQYADFKVAENILHLVNNQGMVWMGMFFSPGLVVINVVKLYLLMYLRTWAVLTCNVPHEIIFRASRSNNFYYALLLMMLFLCVLPVGYAIVLIEPSWHCGPFSGYQKIFHIFTNTIRANVPESMHSVLDYIASPGIVIPLLLLLILIIYYLISLTGALREANNDLKIQLRRERTEERRKMFQLADRRRRGASGESNDQTPFGQWKKLLDNLPSTRSCDDTRQESDDIAPSQRDEDDGKVENKGKVFFTKLIKKALGKSSSSDEEQGATDTDQHDSLPYDKQVSKERKPDVQTLHGIVSKWSLRRNSHKEDKSKSNEEITLEGSTKISGPNQDRIGRNNDESAASEDKAQHTIFEDLEETRTGRKIQDNPRTKINEKSTKEKKMVLEVTVHKAASPKPTKTTLKNDIENNQLRNKKNITIETSYSKLSQDNNEKVVKAKKNYASITEKQSDELEVIESQNPKKFNKRQGSLSSDWSDNIPVITISNTGSDENMLAEGESSNSLPSNHQSRKVKKSSVEPKYRRTFIFQDECHDSRGEAKYEKTFPESTKGYNKTTTSLPTNLDKLNQTTSFRPRVKCILKKQASVIDEDAIIYFGEDLQRTELEKKIISDLINEKIPDASSSVAEEDSALKSSDNLTTLEMNFEGGSVSDISTSDDTDKKDENSVDTILTSPYITRSNENVARSSWQDETLKDNSVDESPIELALDGNDVDGEAVLGYEGSEESLESEDNSEIKTNISDLPMKRFARPDRI